MNDKQLEKTIEEYKSLAEQAPGVDVAALMMHTLQEGLQRNVVSPKQKKWAYLISSGLPPFGLLFAVRYYYGSEDDGKSVAYTCIFLTVASILLFVFLAKITFSSSGTSMQQIEQITPQEIQNTLGP